jgi:hypothetical protein
MSWFDIEDPDRNRFGLSSITRRNLGWRMWWSGPWMPTRLVAATKPLAVVRAEPSPWRTLSEIEGPGLTGNAPAAIVPVGGGQL